MSQNNTHNIAIPQCNTHNSAISQNNTHNIVISQSNNRNLEAHHFYCLILIGWFSMMVVPLNRIGGHMNEPVCTNKKYPGRNKTASHFILLYILKLLFPMKFTNLAFLVSVFLVQSSTASHPKKLGEVLEELNSFKSDLFKSFPEGKKIWESLEGCEGSSERKPA